MLLALICGNMNAGTIVFGELGLENGVQYSDPFDGGDFTVTFAGGGNDGKYYNTGSGIRVYGGGTMSIAAKSGTLTKVVITYDGINSYKPADGTVVDNGTYDAETGIWTGEGRQVTFVRPSGSGHWRVQKIEAIVEGGTQIVVEAPKFSVVGGTYYEPQTVALSCETEGAKILYTIPAGEDPVYTDDNNYTGVFYDGNPLTISKTTTIKAMAVKDGKTSSIVSATYTIEEILNAENIAAFNALEVGKKAILTLKDAQIIAVGNKNIVVKDASGTVDFYNTGLEFTLGQILNGTITGITAEYKTYKQLNKMTDNTLVATDGEIKDIKTISVADAKAATPLSGVYKILGATVEEESGKFYIVDGETKIQLYDQFKYGLTFAAGTFNIEGIVGYYSDVQFWPNKIQEVKDITIAPESGDISVALEEALAGAEAKSVTINLKAGAAYTITKSIKSSGNVVINGNGATIDAAEFTATAIVQMAASAEAPTVITKIDNISFSDLTVKGLTKALFYSSQKKYDIAQFNITNCVIELAADATTIDFTKGSAARNINVLNSTIYAPAATTKSFYSSQAGEKMTEIDAEAIQTFTFKGNTMYNLAKAKNFFTHRQNNQKWLAYDVENNIFVNCGKNGQAIKGMNGGASGANPIWTIKGNAFNFDGADTSATESTGDEAEPVQDSVAGTIAFTDADNGDFSGTFTLAEGATKPEALGDARWTIEFKETPTGISTAKVAETQNGVIYNVAGQKVSSSYKGLVIVNGKKMIQK